MGLLDEGSELGGVWLLVSLLYRWFAYGGFDGDDYLWNLYEDFKEGNGVQVSDNVFLADGNPHGA